VSRILNQDLNLFRVVLGSEHLVHPSHGTGAGDYRNIEEIRVHQNYTSAEMSSSTTTGGNYMRVKINDIGETGFIIIFKFLQISKIYTSDEKEGIYPKL
jgi:hypothetical protein